MPLFQVKIIQKHVSKSPSIPRDKLSVIEKWVELIQSGKLGKLNEIEVHASFTQQIMGKLLGYTAVGENDPYTVAREYRVANGHVDLALGEFCADKSKDKVIAPFELKGAKTKNLDAVMPGRHKTPVQQAFDYARDIKGAKWVLLSNYVELRLYAVSETSLIYEKFLFEDLLIPHEYFKIQLLLGQDNFLSGKTESLLRESENADKDISQKLYGDYKKLRESMLSHLIADNPKYTPAELIPAAQKLLDRILFVSFAEDKKLLPEASVKSAFKHSDPYNPHPIYQNFIGLFNSIDKGNSALSIPAYNGGLFAKDNFLDSLVVSDSLCEGFKDIADYDYDSEVSVLVLGHIFEQSIADLELLTTTLSSADPMKPSRSISAVTGKRKKHGVVYTPDHITRFIIENTLGTHIEDEFTNLFKKYGQYKADGSAQWKKGKKTELRFWYEWQELLQKIKVVDPACGSGAFLIAAFDYLYAEYEKTNNKISELTGQRSIFDLSKQILNNNLFGVDLNEESVEITKLSLWLKTAQRGKPLESLDSNIKVGNSLGVKHPVPGSAFTWETAFESVFSAGRFDVVVGNPPYVRQELLGEIKPWLEKEYSVYHGVLDLYGYFLELGTKLLKSGGRMAYISSSTFFKSGSGKKLRDYLASNIQLEKIIDFGDIQIFEGVTTYPTILVLKNIQPTDREIQILKLKDILPVNLQFDFEHNKGLMKQSQLNKDSWQLEDLRLNTLRKKLISNYPTLKKIYGSPYRGVVTGLNEAFIIDRKTRDEIVRQDPKANEVIKPFLEGKDLKRWHAESRDLWLIAIPKYWTREQLGKSKGEDLSQDDAWVWFSSKYSSLATRLAPFEAKGMRRGDKGEFWWELRACAYYDAFSKTKILYPDLSQGPKFHLDLDRAFSTNTVYFYPDGDYHLLGLLNSNVIWFYLRGVCEALRGGEWRLRLFSQNMDTIPIPTTKGLTSFTKPIQDKSFLLKKCDNDFTRRLVDLSPAGQVFKLSNKLKNWWLLDFKELQKEIMTSFKGKIPLAERNDWQDYFDQEKSNREDLYLEISKLEVRLNAEVYKLFKLTQEEIALIETEVKRA
jgi:type I restriction-modification system DNA methylase subunit